MKVLSLFDGMACGMIAMHGAGIKVDRYVAFEIDKYAVQTSSNNFPMIEHRGDVFQADFTEFYGFDFLIGGSPCTYWSIAQKNNRETEASGIGWELFCQFVRAIKEAKPRYFIYENNKSMAKAIRESITEAFGFEPVCINSALVSAQNRYRLYWVGKRNPDGTYSKVNVGQPKDREILMKDVVDGCCESVCMRWQRSEKAKAVRRQYEAGEIHHGFNELNELHPRPDYKTNTLSTVLKDNPICEPVVPHNGTGLYAIPVEPMRVKEATKQGYTEILPGYCVDMTQPNSKTRRGRNMERKSNCLMTQCQYYQCCGIIAYATPCEYDKNGIVTKAISSADGKVYNVYPVDNGMITIKGKQYKIKLVDGYYILRNLTVAECKRLQTVPAWYEFPVSDSQAYKMLGNGWTVEVIVFLLNCCVKE